MKAKSSVGLAAALLSPILLFAAAPSIAQQRMSAVPLTSAPRAVAARARPAAAHVARPAAARRAAPASAVQSSGLHFNTATNSFEFADGSPATLQDLLNPVPGLGFDYHHLSVINQNLAIKALIDPATEMKLAEARRFRRGSHFGGPGFYLLDGGFYYPPSDDSGAADSAVAPAGDQSAQQQPQVIVVQQPQQAQSAPADSTEAAAESAPLPDVGQFTLVLQNGQRLQAVAFTRANDKIVYITADGFRGSISIADLNTDATKQINADRGTPIQLPL